MTITLWEDKQSGLTNSEMDSNFTELANGCIAQSVIDNRPLVKPTLNLDFTKGILDSRITFTRNSTATYFGSDGLLKTAGINQPRFEYDPITRQPKGLLIEESRTNIMWPSTTVGNNGDGTSSVSGAVVKSPDGTTTANLYIPINSSRYFSYYTYNIFASGISGAVTESVFIKPSAEILANGYIGYMTSASVAGFFRYTFVSGIGTLSTGATTTSATVTPVGGGWYRLSTTFTDTGASKVHHAWIAGVTDGTTSSSFALWGLQTEAGAFPTSYIPTTSAQVTRSADVANMTGTNFSSWFRQDEGAIFCETGPTRGTYPVSYAFFGEGMLRLDKNSASATENTAYEFRYTGNASNVILSSLSSTIRKSAASYKTNDFAFFGDNFGLVTNNAGKITTVSGLYIGVDSAGTRQPNTYIKKIIYYPVRLTNTQLQEITK